MPDIITEQEQEAIDNFIAANVITKCQPGSSAPYGEEVMGASGYWNRERRKAWALNEQIRTLNSQGYSIEQISERMGVGHAAVYRRGLKLGIWNG